MNPDPNNPTTPTEPTAPDFSNPAAAAAPTMEAPAAPEMPATPEAPAVAPNVPTIDPSLLQQAINDVPEEAAETTPEVPTAVPLDGAAATPETSPFAGAAPAADLTAAPEATAPAADPNVADPNAAVAPAEGEAQKSTPSVAFNDPAQQPDAAKPHEIKLPNIMDKVKANPVAFIVGGCALIIVALVLIIAFAV